MSALPSLVLLLIFVVSAVVIWVAGIKLSDYTDVLAERLHLGAALGGVVLLAVATNLPEIAITVSAALSGHVEIAVGNLLGGIAIQTVVLVALDAAGLKLIGGPASRLPWTGSGEAPHGQDQPRGHARTSTEQHATSQGVSTTRAATVFGVAALLTLIAGVTIERSGEQFFGDLGLSGVLFGATVLAAATSLPELSTGLAAARKGDYKLAMGDIFGGNAFLPVLFLLATVISGKSVLPAAQASDIYLTALGGLLTVVYLVGLIFRPQRQPL